MFPYFLSLQYTLIMYFTLGTVDFSGISHTAINNTIKSNVNCGVNVGVNLGMTFDIFNTPSSQLGTFVKQFFLINLEYFVSWFLRP